MSSTYIHAFVLATRHAKQFIVASTTVIQMTMTIFKHLVSAIFTSNAQLILNLDVFIPNFLDFSCSQRSFQVFWASQNLLVVGAQRAFLDANVGDFRVHFHQLFDERVPLQLIDVNSGCVLFSITSRKLLLKTNVLHALIF